MSSQPGYNVDDSSVALGTTTESWLQFFKDGQTGPGTVDILCLGDSALERVATLVATNLLHLGSSRDAAEGSERECYYTQVISPPVFGDDVQRSIREEILDIACRIVEDKCQRPLDEGDVSYVSDHFSIQFTEDLTVDSLVLLLKIESQKRFRFQYVLRAGDFRTMIETPGYQRASVRKLWIPYLKDMAGSAVTAAKANGTCVILDIGDYGPSDRDETEALSSIKECGVYAICNRLEIQISDRIQLWEELLRAGKVGSVLSDIDTTAGDTLNATILKIQFLARAKMHRQAAEMVASHIEGLLSLGLDPQMALRLGELAEKGDEDAVAGRLLNASLSERNDLVLLQRALTLANRLSDNAAFEEIERILVRSFPASRLSLRRKFEEYIARLEFDEIDKTFSETLITSENQEAVEFYRQASHHLRLDQTAAFIDLVKTRFPLFANEASLICSVYRFRRNEYREAIRFAALIALDSGQAESGCSLIIHSIAAAFLAPATLPAHDEEIYVLAILTLVRFMSAHPEVVNIRRRFVNSVLAVDSDGTSAAVVLGSIAQRQIEKNRDVRKGKSASPSVLLDMTQFSELFISTSDWLGTEQMFFLGKGELPDGLVPSPEVADDFVSKIGALIEHTLTQDLDDSTEPFIRVLLHIGMLWAEHSSIPERSMVLLRIAGASMATAGRLQYARDLAEQGLALSAGMSANRKRTAWTTFSDLYNRCHNVFEGLLGIACSLTLDVDEISPEQDWFESSLLVRLARDFRLPDLAIALLPSAADAFHAYDPQDRYRHRFLHLRNSVFWFSFLQTNRDSEIEPLLTSATLGCRLALDADDDLIPCCILLGQVIGLVRMRQLSYEIGVPEDTFGAALMRLPPALANRIRSLAMASYDSDTLSKFLMDAELARHTSDVAFDATPAAMAAHGVLTNVECLDAETAALAAEALTDRSVRFPQGESCGGHICTSEALLASLQSFASGGVNITVHYLALDFYKRLVRTTWSSGKFTEPAVEPKDVFDYRRFVEWSREYPYAYGLMDSFASVFSNAWYHSMQNIGVSAPASGTTVVISDTLLQKIPVNILLSGGEFLGAHVPSASAPSLSWLEHASKSRTFGDGRRMAWISRDHNKDGPQALDSLADRICPTLQDFGIHLFDASEPPEMSGAELAIVGAHGRVGPDNSYFQMIADEGSLRMSSRSLASCIGRVRVVVLFVCNAGRTDEHPFSHSTIGLGRRLLTQGCNAVISSPWPLNVQVPVIWLPPFLAACSAGFPVVEANFLANGEVQRHMGMLPSHGLAMTVFGDPFVRIFD